MAITEIKTLTQLPVALVEEEKIIIGGLLYALFLKVKCC